MNTAAVAARFWERMRETYGARWVEQYTETPQRAWVELLERFPPAEINSALSDLQSVPHLRQYPPTLPQFEQLLTTASKRGRAELTAADYRRGYWRAAVIHGVIREANALLGRAIWNAERFEPVMVANRETLGRAMRELLDELDDLEARTGQRTTGIERRCSTGCYVIARAFRTALTPPEEPVSDAESTAGHQAPF